MNFCIKLVSRLLFASGYLLLCACNAVYSVNPVGETPLQLDAEQWDGDWRGADGIMKIKVKSSETGTLQVAWIEDMELEIYNVHLLESGGWQFFNLKDENDEDGESEGYFWGRIRKNDNAIYLWDPDITKFRSLVRDGALPGEARKSGKDNEHESDVILGELTPEHMELITSEQKGVLFDWDEPLVLLKISD